MVTLLCAAARPVVSVSASSAPASLAIVFFIGFLRSAGGTIEQPGWLEKQDRRRWPSAFRRNSMSPQEQFLMGRIIHESPCNRTVDRHRFCRRVRRNPPAAAGAGCGKHHSADHPYQRDGGRRARKRERRRLPFQDVRERRW